MKMEKKHLSQPTWVSLQNSLKKVARSALKKKNPRDKSSLVTEQGSVKLTLMKQMFAAGRIITIPYFLPWHPQISWRAGYPGKDEAVFVFCH